MKKKVLTMVMALCMVLCLIPTVAYAEGGTGAVAIVENVQALIDALPTAEELEGADEATVNQAYISAQEAYDAIEELEPEELAQLTGVEKLTNLMDWFNGQTSMLATQVIVSNENDFNFDSTTGTVTGITVSDATDVIIPDKINGTDVVAIGYGAFARCSLESIIIPSSVTTIGDSAFFNCTDLDSITIMDSEATPSRLTTIGEQAFLDCAGLTSISLPSSVTTIGGGAFYGCTGLDSITITDSEATPSRLTTIGEKAFYCCRNLESISLPSSVTTIEDSAFSGCAGLTSISLPSSVTTIGGGVFYGCAGLTSISLPSSVTEISGNMFYGCTGLTSISLPSSVTTIEDSAFSGCAGLTSISLPNNVIMIGGSAFYGCAGLTSISIPSSVTEIGYSAFSGCTGLTSISIPNGVTTIKNGTFWNCAGLTSISLPSSVTEIEGNAFTNCTGLESISLPNSVTTIGAQAFSGCTGLESISLPNSVTKIGSSAFYGCTSLESISLPNSVTTIEYEAFSGCTGLTSISIPSSVTKIEFDAFSNCTSLTNVYFIGSADKWSDINIVDRGNTALNNSVKNINVTYVLPSDLVYNGQSKEATVDKNDLTLGDITIKYYGEDGNLITGSPVDGGRYTVKIDISGSNPYSDIELGNFTITQAPNSFTSDLSIADWTAGEAPNSPAITAKYGTVVYSYSTEKDGTYTETVPTAAGSYWVNASVTETASYKGLEAKKQFNILAKPEPVVPTPEPSEPTPEEVTPTTPPQIINGKGQSVTAGEATELSFRSDAVYRDFIRVELDGKNLDEKNYTVREGSTIVTLKAEYVATLSKGEHTISIVSVNGVATTTFTVSEKPVTKSPQTGDDSHIFMWMALLVVSGGLLAAGVKRKN